jgi:S1-C subfamily serine protease
MADPDSLVFSRVCPSCGRRVPRKVAVCRCGAEIGADEASELALQTPMAPPTPESSSSFHRSAAVIGLVVAAFAAGAIWMRTPPSAPAPVDFRTSVPSSSEEKPEAQPTEPQPTAAEALPSPMISRDVDTPGSPAVAIAPTPPSLEDVVSRVMPAVVQVETPDGRGSGFFVSPDTLLTNVHVVGRNSSVTIRRMGGQTMSARVTAQAREFDVAVLKISNPDAAQAVIALGSALDARVGQDVIAIGSALGTLQNTVSRGIVSAVRQSGGALLVQTDAAINPGNSGGPLLDRSGVALGITTMGYSGRQGLNFAVAADHARALLEGRPPSPTPSSGRNNDMVTLSPAVPSESEQTRAAGVKALEQTLAQLARLARDLDDYWAQFRRACYEGQVAAAGLDHEWFALFDDRAMRGAVSPGCGAAFADVRQRAAAVRDAVTSADEAARQAGVYPGVRREIRRKYRLDYPGWER